MSDGYGIFVAPSGSDEAPGGKLTPVKTIARGLALARENNKRVFVCNGTYDEALTISAGAKLYGGYTCPETAAAAWEYQPGTVAKVAPSVAGFALQISNLQDQALEISDMHFVVQPGVNAGESSIAAIVTSSLNVRLTRVTLQARDAMPGANAAYPFILEFARYPTAAELRGADALLELPGAATTWRCPAGDTTVGGVGGVIGQGGGKGQPITYAGGAGGNWGVACENGGMGSSGADAAAQSDAAGATINGRVNAILGWVPTEGKDGAHGLAGQGGGGGAAGTGGGGGGGGAGGCGGQGGPGGKGGGSSIALLAIGSPVVLNACTLTTGNAGAGGAGLPGKLGQAEVGARGNGAASATGTGEGCDGGPGGLGGKAGAGGGGAGGVSVGVVYANGVPQIGDSIFNLGKLGARGPGGNAGVNDGIDGVVDKTLEAVAVAI